MAVSVTGTMTLSTDVSPIHDATTLTTLLGKSPEQLTVAQLNYLGEAIKRAPKGEHPSSTLATILTPYL